MLVKIIDILNDIDTSPFEITHRVMPSLPHPIRMDTLPSIQEYRDVTIIKRSIRTSNCAYIETEREQVIHSSKTRVLHSDTSHICSLEVRKLLAEVNDTQKTDTRVSMRTIYETFLKNQRSRNFNGCDEILRSINVAEMDLEVLVSILMASYSMKRYLPNRAFFFNKVYEKAKFLYSISEADMILCNLQ